MIIPSRAAVDAYCGVRTTLYQRIAGILAPVIHAGVFLFIALRWHTLPEQVPTHYDFAGNVTAWGSRWTLLIMPAIGLVTDIAMTILLRFPRSWNAGVKITVFNKARVFKLIRDMIADLRISLALLFAFITVWILRLSQTFPGWVLSAVMIPLIIVPMLRYFIRLYIAK